MTASFSPDQQDATTGLLTRAGFLDRLAAAVIDAGEAQQGFGLLLVAVRDKNDNDLADVVLRSGARRLSELFAATQLARISADTFAVLLPDLSDGESLRQHAQQVVDKFALPLKSLGVSFSAIASVGGARFPTDAETASELLGNAELAKARAMEVTTSRYVTYKPGIRPTVEGHVREGIRAGGALLRYQPIVRIDAPQAVVGFEGLMRWQHQQLGILFPGQAPSIFDEVDLAVQLGTIALETATLQMREWLDRDIKFGRLALNISAAQLVTSDLAHLVATTLGAAGVDVSHLALEIGPEAYLTPEGDRVAESLHALKAAGVHLTLDGLGADPDALACLEQFPISSVKLDPAFVRKEAGWALLPELLAHAERSGITVVAKGVEVRDQVIRLHGLGCKQLQGYVVARPMPPERVPAFLDKYAGFSGLRPPEQRDAA